MNNTKNGNEQEEETPPPKKKRATAADLLNMIGKGFDSAQQMKESGLYRDSADSRTPEQNLAVEAIKESNKKGTRYFMSYGPSETKLCTSTEVYEMLSDFVHHTTKSISEQSPETHKFFLVKDDNRKLVTSDAKLAKEVAAAMVQLQERHKLDFDSRCIPACLERVYFCSDIKSDTQQLCVLCRPEGNLAEKFISASEEGEEAILRVGVHGIRFKIAREQMKPHIKVSMRVKNHDLMSYDGFAITAAVRLRLAKDEPDVEFLKSGFVRQTNIFEVMLSGSTIPSSFRDEPYLSCRGVTMSMAFSGEPLCEECESREHTTKMCPVAKARRAERKCHACNEKGHLQAGCPNREPLECYSCGQTGHFKVVCPNSDCYTCGKKGHMSRHCEDNTRKKQKQKQKKQMQKQKKNEAAKKKTQKEKKKANAPPPPPPPAKKGEGGEEARADEERDTGVKCPPPPPTLQ